ncbi:FtsX-like permease family protein [Streptomyces sp. NPDC005483]|uniref:ABC transporter permease n=1 Tax=Streptomyces sp. NPDC005483 TaxID=3154882 RepID=UPI0033A4AC80
MRATLRWTHSDLRSHRGEALFIVVATLGVVTSLLTAVALFGYATNPWERVFAQSHGAHVWLHLAGSADTRPLTGLDGVEAVAGPYRTESVTVSARGIRAAAELRGTPVLPSVGRPLVTSGHWIDPRQPDGVVLESRLAHALLAAPGDAVTLPGTGRMLTVVGVADTAEPRYRPGDQPGLVWAAPAALHGSGNLVVGLRLADHEDTDYAVQRAVTVLGSGAVGEISTWQQARAAAQGDNRLLGQVLGLFGLASLLAAGLTTHGAISTRVQGQLRDISVLKAIGFTPGQVVRIFLLQHVAYALAGSLLSAVLFEAAGDRLPGQLGEAVGVWQRLPSHTTALLAVPVGAVLFISAVTGLAAWRAGRVPSVPVLRQAAPVGGPLPGLTRRTLGLGLPPGPLLGWHLLRANRLRTLVTIGRFTLPLLLIVAALSAWTTIDRFHSRPDRLGLAAALTVRPNGGVSEPETRALLDAEPEVAAVYPGAELAALVPGQTATIALRGLGTHAHPYPYALAEGRPPRGPDEAVAGQGLLDLLDARVGDWVRMTVGGSPQILHIVGRSIEVENGGRVVSTTLDILRENDPGLRADIYQLRLRPGADPHRVAGALLAHGRGHLDVHTVANPADGLPALRGIVAGLAGVLALIGAVELLTVIGGALREGQRDLPALWAIGLSPRQIASITVSATAGAAAAAVLLALAAGLPLAHWLINAQGRSNGVGSGIAALPSPASLLLFGCCAVGGAVLLAAVPAARAARLRLTDTLDTVA